MHVKKYAVFAYITCGLYQKLLAEPFLIVHNHTLKASNKVCQVAVSYGTVTAITSDVQHSVARMKCSKAVSAVFVSLVVQCLALPVALAMPNPQDQKKDSSGKQKGSAGSSLTGCVDEQQGHYVLVDEHNLNVIADLVADGFPTEGFAKHVGHKVIVRGTANSDAARPVWKVRNIETVSEICAPKEP